MTFEYLSGKCLIISPFRSPQEPASFCTYYCRARLSCFLLGRMSAQNAATGTPHIAAPTRELRGACLSCSVPLLRPHVPLRTRTRTRARGRTSWGAHRRPLPVLFTAPIKTACSHRKRSMRISFSLQAVPEVHVHACCTLRPS